MDIEDHGMITGSEKELTSGVGSRHVWTPKESGTIEPCPVCHSDKKVFRAAGKLVCQNKHKETA